LIDLLRREMQYVLVARARAARANNDPHFTLRARHGQIDVIAGAGFPDDVAALGGDARFFQRAPHHILLVRTQD